MFPPNLFADLAPLGVVSITVARRSVQWATRRTNPSRSSASTSLVMLRADTSSRAPSSLMIIGPFTCSMPIKLEPGVAHRSLLVLQLEPALENRHEATEGINQ